MPAVAPTTIPASGLVPDYNDRSTFGARVLAWDLWTRDVMVPGVNASAQNAYTNALAAYDAVAQATAQAAAAAAYAAAAQAALVTTGIETWVSGTTYAINTRVLSPDNGRVYTRLIAGAGTTDPSTDTTNWSIFGGSLTIIEVTGNMTAVPNTLYVMTGNYQLTFPAVGTLLKGDTILVSNASGLKTSTINIGSAKLRGQTLSDGIITVNDIHTRFELSWSGNTTYGWV